MKFSSLLDQFEIVKEKSFIVVAGIPACDEEKDIAKTILRVKEYVDQVIVCDDGSSDLTGEIAAKLGALVIKHERNMGYGAALASLFSASEKVGADFLITIDGDGQHDIAQIPALLGVLKSGEADLVIGSRVMFPKYLDEVPFYRRLGLGIINGLTKKVSYAQLTDSQSGFRAYGREAIRLLRPIEQGMGASTEILLKAKRSGLTLKELPTKITYYGSSKRNPLVQGLEVVLSTLKQISINKPLLFYGLPSILSFFTLLAFWVWTLGIFGDTHMVATNFALIIMGVTVMGLLSVTMMVILWLISSILGESVP